MILCRETPKDSIKNLLELIIKFSKISGHKINIQKLVAYPYTNNERSVKEMRKTFPQTIASNRIKQLGINLMKKMKEIYTANCKVLMKAIEKDINK